MGLWLTAEIGIGKPVAGEELPQVTVFLRTGGAPFVEQAPVDRNNAVYIGRAFHTAFDF